jgi:LPS-assembly protein
MRVTPPEPLAPGTMARVKARDQQEKTGSKYRLRGEASVQTDRFIIRADEIDYDQDTAEAEARGHVYMLHFEGGEELWADRVEYNTEEETGKFYNVRGVAPVHIEARPGQLTTSNPFYFEGKWAERLKDRYILYNGFITNCRMPDPWWKLKGPKFDVIPNDRAIAHNSFFRLRNIPIFYMPFFRKSLERMPRKSGFLTPNAGNSSRRGKMFGIGYYWAINRSYDASYRAQYFTQRGIAHTVDLRGKVSDRTDFDLYLYGVNDRGLKQANGERLKQGGLLFSFRGRSDLGHGWYARTESNYLSSMTFRQAFTETFVEAISSEVHSVGFVAKDWSTYTFNTAFDRLQAFRFAGFQENQSITIRKLPELRFVSRDRKLFKDVPVWVSWESSAGLLRRDQPLFQTSQYMDRMHVYPRVMTLLR